MRRPLSSDAPSPTSRHRRTAHRAVVGGLAVALMAGVFGLASPTAQAATTVVPDPGFAACLNYSLHQAADAPISAAQLAGLTGWVNCDGNSISSSISSLEGVQYLSGISSLELNYNQIASLAGVTFPAGLTSLSLYGNRITSLTGMTFPAGLTSLSLGDNQITSLAGVTFPAGLTSLSLDGNRITSLTGVTFPANLTGLYLDDNQITNLAGVTFPANLTGLYLVGNQITSLAGVTFPTGLTSLDLGYNRIASLAGVTFPAGLTSLGLYNNRIASLAGVTFPTGLTTLYLYGNRITSLAGVTFPTGLTTLSVWDQASSLTVTAGVATTLPVVPLARMGGLTWTVQSGSATISGNQVTAGSNAVLIWATSDGTFSGTLTVTAGPPALDTANLITDAALRKCLIDNAAQRWGLAGPSNGIVGQHWLDAYAAATYSYDTYPNPGFSGNGIECSGVASLAGLQNLHDPDTFGLWLTNSTVTDFSPLAGMTSLVELHVNSSNLVAVPASIVALTGLKVLNLDGNKIGDLSPLAGLGYLNASAFSARTEALSMSVTAGVATTLPVVPLSWMGAVTWKTTSGTATVSGGKVTVPAAGTAVVSWTDASGVFTGTVMVTAAPVVVSSVSVSPGSVSVVVGGTATLSVSVLPANASSKAVSWASSNTAVATVDASGKVTGKAAGTATVTASAADGSKKVGSAVVTVSGAACVSGAPSKPMGQFRLGADMTGDGRGETLAVDAQGVLWMFPGTASGVLGSPCRLGTGFAAHQVYGPGDVNGDGRADIMTITGDGKLWLYSGNGAGPLTRWSQVGSGWVGWKMIPSGDLNGDKKPDLLGINPQGLLFFYAGTGVEGLGAAFAARVQVGSGWLTGWGLYAAGDLNADGKNDILGVNPSGLLFMYPGAGSGRFTARVQVGSGWTTYQLASGADLNGDGLGDILGRNNKTGDLYLYAGAGYHPPKAVFPTKVNIATGW